LEPGNKSCSIPQILREGDMTKAKYLRTALLVAGMMTFAGTLNAQ
jgi:hypothetical protein